MRSFEQYDEICKHFTKGLQEDNNVNEVQKHLQLYDLSIGQYLTDEYALWLDFRMIDENSLHGMGRSIENASEGITLQIEKKAELLCSCGQPCKNFRGLKLHQIKAKCQASEINSKVLIKDVLSH